MALLLALLSYCAIGGKIAIGGKMKDSLFLRIRFWSNK